MPIYEYECEKCHSRFEMKRSFGEDGAANARNAVVKLAVSLPQCR